MSCGLWVCASLRGIENFAPKLLYPKYLCGLRVVVQKYNQLKKNDANCD
jgi:hypothetical protein